MDVKKLRLVEEGKPGSVCPKRYLVSNTEFTEKTICTASRQYQTKKIAELDLTGLVGNDYQKKFDKIVDKSCICTGLGTAALLINDIETKINNHLRDKTNMSCPMCGNNNWIVDPTFKFQGTLDPETKKPIEGQAFPVFTTTCNKCFFVCSYAANRLGFLD